MPTPRVYHYRDFPGLIWDLRPDAVIDRDSPAVLARVLGSGSTEAIRALVDFDVVRHQFDALWLPDPVRYVWRIVLGLPAGTPHRQAKP
jgi:hypothetical protein